MSLFAIASMTSLPSTPDPGLHPLAAVLDEALQDEYKALATYTAVIDRFGPVRPFVNIAESERRHVQALAGLYGRHGLAMPQDAWAGRVQAPATLEEACRLGVQAEIDNAEMYERLLLQATAFPDVLVVMRRLQWASQQNHLRAFQRCSQRPGSADAQLGCCGGRGGRQRRRRGGRIERLAGSAC